MSNIVRRELDTIEKREHVLALIDRSGHPVSTREPRRSKLATSSQEMAKGLRYCDRNLAGGRTMKRVVIAFPLMFLVIMLGSVLVHSDEFSERAAKIAEYKKWLDTLGPRGSHYWMRLDGRQRPHRLYLGEGFYRADLQTQEHFVNTFSSYLAGHPDKFMLIDLFDMNTNKPVGEYGFGGFKLYKLNLRTDNGPQK